VRRSRTIRRWPLQGSILAQCSRLLGKYRIDRVVVTDGDVEIRYVIPTTPASEHVRFCHLRTDYFHHIATGIDGFVEEQRPPRSSCPLRALVASLWNGVRDLPLPQPAAAPRVARALVSNEAIRTGAWSPTACRTGDADAL
jgi:hypothetical protein